MDVKKQIFHYIRGTVHAICPGQFVIFVREYFVTEYFCTTETTAQVCWEIIWNVLTFYDLFINKISYQV